MKMNIVKCIVVVAALLTSMLILTACDSGEADTPLDEPPPAQTQDADANEQEVAEDDAAVADDGPAVTTENIDWFDDPVGWLRNQAFDELTVVTSFKGVSDAFLFPEGRSITNNAYLDMAEDLMNIRVEYNWTVDMSQYGTRLSLAIASGDLPDFFRVDPANFVMLKQDGLIADLTDYFNELVSPSLKEMYEFFPEGFESAWDNNGRIMAMPQMGYGPITAPDIMWARSDWMEAAGLSAPQTIDELTDMARIFMSDFGATYGIALESSVTSFIHGAFPIFNAFHAYPNIWIRDNTGQLVFGSIQPEVRDGLAALQYMIDEGILSREFGVMDVDRVNEDIVNGSVGITFAPNWASYWPFPDAIHYNPEARWRAFPVPASDSRPVYLQAYWPINGYYVANINSPHAEALIKLHNVRFLSHIWPEHEVLPDDFWLTEAQAGPVYIHNPMVDYMLHLSIVQAIETGNTEHMTDLQRMGFEAIQMWIDYQDVDASGVYFQRSHEGSHAVIIEYVHNDRILFDRQRGPEPPGFAAVRSTLDTMQATVFVRIIMGESLDLFDQFVADWLAMGGEDAIIEVNEMYN